MFLDLNGCVLVDEFVDCHEAPADSDFDAVLSHFDLHPLGPKLVHTCALSHEEDFEFLPLWVVVKVVCHFNIDSVIFDGYVDGNFCLEL